MLGLSDTQWICGRTECTDYVGRLVSGSVWFIMIRCAAPRVR